MLQLKHWVTWEDSDIYVVFVNFIFRAWFESHFPELICEACWSWDTQRLPRGALGGTWLDLPLVENYWNYILVILKKKSPASIRERMMAAVTMPPDALVGPQGNEEVDSLIVLHYNYTGKLILREKATDKIDLPTISFLILCSFIVLENLMV